MLNNNQKQLKTKSRRRRRTPKLTSEQRQSIEKMVRSIGYDPMDRRYYINKKVNGVPFRLYSIYYKDVEYYIRGKMRRAFQGRFANNFNTKTKKVGG